MAPPMSQWEKSKRLVIRHSLIYFAMAGVGYYIGWYLDRHEDLRMTKFRDKSALFGRELKPGEAPSWP